MQRYTIDEFKGLSEEAQFKEIYAVYGYSTANLSMIDNHFLIQLRWVKTDVEKVSQSKMKKFEREFKRATLGTVITEYRDVFDTSKFDAEIDELLKVRNTLAHEYFKANQDDLKVVEKRFEIYEDLLGSVKMVSDFFQKIKGETFNVRRKPSYGIRRKP